MVVDRLVNLQYVVHGATVNLLRNSLTESRDERSTSSAAHRSVEMITELSPPVKCTDERAAATVAAADSKHASTCTCRHDSNNMNECRRPAPRRASPLHLCEQSYCVLRRDVNLKCFATGLAGSQR